MTISSPGQEKPLFFMRHGETYFNAQGRVQGRLDTPLSPRGRDQAAAAGRILRQTLDSFTISLQTPAYVASPLSRTCETMERARRAMGLDPDAFTRDARLIELSFGDWQGFTWPEIKTKDPQAVVARQENIWTFRPPGGESYADLTERVEGWLHEAASPTVVVAHGGVARALLRLVAGLTPAQAYAQPIAQGRILMFSQGNWRWI